jgi:hypothetical protein
MPRGLNDGGPPQFSAAGHALPGGGLLICEASKANIADLGEEDGHRVLRVCGKGTRTVLIPLPPAVGRAIDHAVGDRPGGPILLNTRGLADAAWTGFRL